MDSPSHTPSSLLMLDWSRQDPENRMGFKAGRFTSPNKWLSFLIGALLTVIFYALLSWDPLGLPWFKDMFTKRGPCPYPTMFLFFWALAMLMQKALKFRFQQRARRLPILPQQNDFELTPASARALRHRMASLVDQAQAFILLNRIDLALANLHNIGHTADVAAILKIQAENDEAQVSSSYSLIQGFLWAIPVLGFIGTVQGLSQAIGAFASTLAAGAEITAIRASLQDVTAGLATAFETTLVALVCALLLQLLVSWLQTRESEFLDDCNDYCHQQVAGKLRLGQHENHA